MGSLYQKTQEFNCFSSHHLLKSFLYSKKCDLKSLLQIPHKRLVCLTCGAAWLHRCSFLQRPVFLLPILVPAPVAAVVVMVVVDPVLLLSWPCRRLPGALQVIVPQLHLVVALRRQRGCRALYGAEVNDGLRGWSRGTRWSGWAGSTSGGFTHVTWTASTKYSPLTKKTQTITHNLCVKADNEALLLQTAEGSRRINSLVPNLELLEHRKLAGRSASSRKRWVWLSSAFMSFLSLTLPYTQFWANKITMKG